MKDAVKILFALMLFCTACDYRVPVTNEHSIKIDENIVGVWEQQVDDGQKGQKMLILKFSDTEYLVQYPLEKNSLYFRAYPFILNSNICIHIQLLGNADGFIGKIERPYQVLDCVLKDGGLNLKMLNTEVVNKEIQESSKLRDEIIAKSKAPDLFKDIGRFKQVSPKINTAK